MRIVIVGGSKFGVAAAERFIEQGHDVVLIDKDREKLERLSDSLDCGMIEGDGSSPSILREAYSDEEDVLIALTNASDDNILTAIVARSVGFGRVIPQIISPELLEVCKELELTDTITPHATVARSLCRALEEDTEVSEELNLAGALIEEEEETLPQDDSTLAAGMYVLFVVPTENVDDLETCFST